MWLFHCDVKNEKKKLQPHAPMRLIKDLNPFKSNTPVTLNQTQLNEKKNTKNTFVHQRDIDETSKWATIMENVLLDAHIQDQIVG